MRKFTRPALVALLVAAGSAAQAQQTTLPTLPNSTQILRDAVALHDKGDYAGAIAQYRTVPSSDTAYVRVLGELSLSYLSNKQYKEAADVSRRAIALHTNDAEPYVILAEAEEQQDHIPEALQAYTEGLRRFPYSQTLWYNQGVTQKNKGRYAEALASLQRSLELNPTHANSHFLLGGLAAQQGQTARAMLSLMTYLAIRPDTEQSNGVLVSLEQLATGTLEVEEKERVKPFVPNEAFQELDLLLNSKVALRNDYTSKVKFNANVVKQLQLLVEKFPAATGAAAESDFWLRTYGPLVSTLRKNDNLTAFTYLILMSADDKKPAQWVKSNKKKVEALGSASADALNELRAYQVVQRQGKPVRMKAWYDSEGSLDGFGEGEVGKDGKMHLRGDWTMVQAPGYVVSEGAFSPNGERTGTWHEYYDNGQLHKVLDYAAGKQEGSYKEYFDNGELSVEGAYRNGEPEGDAKLYYYCGIVREVRPYRNGAINGEAVFYYADGKVRRREQYKADKQDGPETAYYPDGTVEYRYAYLDGKLNGPFEVFGPQKNLEKKGAYEKGELHGAYTDYHPNGQVHNAGTFAQGKRTGTWREFYADGKPSTEISYDNAGELHGPYRDFDEDGKLFAEFTYDHGRVTRTAYLDKAGKTINQTDVARKGKTTIQGFRPDGTPSLTGTYTDGLMEGEWRWLHRSGTPSKVRHYTQGKQEGLEESYFVNGRVQARQQYHNDEADGYYETFYMDGQPRRNGFYQRGQQQGPWHDYYADGRLSETYNFLNGDLNGLSQSYAPTGQLTKEKQYEQDRLVQITAYDSTGQVLSHVALTPKTKSYTLAYLGGKPLFKTDINCFTETGQAVWYTPTGQVQYATTRDRDQNAGPHRAYHPNGKLAAEGQFHHGVRVGPWKMYYPSGALLSTGTYDNGDLVGEWLTYFEDGKVEYRTTYAGGERHGPTLSYNRLGELMLEKVYENGLPVRYRGPGPDGRPTGEYKPVPVTGSLKTTFANGKTAAEETYRQGDTEGARTYYYSTGQVYRRIQHKDGVLSGLLTTYYPTGKPFEEEQYQHDKLHGRSRYYRPDGTPEREETYRCGEKCGPTIYYNTQGKPTKMDVYWDTYVYGSK
ncbi:toxin-antitoxin system YwqK family antitoxin [Hymenobacter profundi]|uniref:Tetratricopeptide repeat protein n=1 Tax=Hymenobacter profundi TaxID=1982110 RepID=A0ABS6WV70_9BACT|nr:toxin-antitoxin system YwqK family antitoxin [Hymenobacter profundi]MBW3127479.1 tetratricopeptide repeat protein [Hymenobacter profundi]